MENASKALIIAGGVLIAITIVSIGVLLINRYRTTADSYISRLDMTEIQKYNSNINVFEGRTDITAQEIVTLVNRLEQNNWGTKIYVDGKDYTDLSDSELIKLLEENILTHKSDGTVTGYFSYVEDSIKYNKDGIITQIKFKKN